MEEMEKEEQQGLEEKQAVSQEIMVASEQHTITFYEKPILVIRLDDGRPAVVLRSLCDNLSIDTNAQVRRVRRTEAVAEDLAQAQIETEGGPQTAYVLVLRSVPYWLATLDPRRARPEVREEIVRYQRECVDVLYTWAQQPHVHPEVKATQQAMDFDSSTVIGRSGSEGRAFIVPVEAPSLEATHSEKATYHELMSVWHRHQADLHAQVWRSEVEARIEEQETRIEAKEAVVDLVPEILERLGPQLITTQQQRQVQAYVEQLSTATGKHPATIYNELKTAFDCPRYDQLKADEWPLVVNWFKGQIERAKNRGKKP